MITNIGTPSSHNKIPRMDVASLFGDVASLFGLGQNVAYFRGFQSRSQLLSCLRQSRLNNAKPKATTARMLLTKMYFGPPPASSRRRRISFAKAVFLGPNSPFWSPSSSSLLLRSSRGLATGFPLRPTAQTGP
jgi:hypothetical protein